MKKPILIMAAGTGGHIFPALAIARELRARRLPIIWLGTTSGLEKSLVQREGIPFYAIRVKGLRGNGLKRWLIAPFMLIFAFLQAIGLLLRLKPAAVLGMGGYVCGPGGLAAWLLHKPLFLHEQNSVAGLTNRLLKPFARKIFTAFPSVLSSSKTSVVGNPLRADIIDLPPPADRFSGREGKPFHILVFGGSLGARVLTEVVPEAFHQLQDEFTCDIWHQAGERNLEITQRTYRAWHLKANIVPFIDNMAVAYAWADLVICRAGATTVSEISAIGVPAIFVPYPFHKDQQQVYNARFLVEHDAAVMIQQPELTPKKLTETLRGVLNRDRLLAMAERGRELRAVAAVDKIVEELMYDGSSND